MFAHQEADRVPMVDYPWQATLARWRDEGMPQDANFEDYFGFDKIACVGVDNSPRYPYRTLESNDEYAIITTEWGATIKRFHHRETTPQFLDFTITDPKSWQSAKERMTVSDERIPWDMLKNNYANWRKEGQWIQADFWFGFDVTHSWAVGTETLLIALLEEPDWCVEMFNHYLDLDIALFDRILDAGYTFDSIKWPDDMGYKHSQFFSVKQYRKLLKPVHARAVQWAHDRGMKTLLHSCGDVNPFIPELIDIGVDGLNPLEVKAGMDPIAIKQQYGDKLLLNGGINALLWEDADKICAEMDKIFPVVKQNGGYIFSSDHSIPSSVSLDNFKKIVAHAKQLGKY